MTIERMNAGMMGQGSESLRKQTVNQSLLIKVIWDREYTKQEPITMSIRIRT